MGMPGPGLYDSCFPDSERRPGGPGLSPELQGVLARRCLAHPVSETRRDRRPTRDLAPIGVAWDRLVADITQSGGVASGERVCQALVGRSEIWLAVGTWYQWRHRALERVRPVVAHGSEGAVNMLSCRVRGEEEGR